MGLVKPCQKIHHHGKLPNSRFKSDGLPFPARGCGSTQDDESTTQLQHFPVRPPKPMGCRNGGGTRSSAHRLQSPASAIAHKPCCHTSMMRWPQGRPYCASAPGQRCINYHSSLLSNVLGMDLSGERCSGKRITRISRIIIRCLPTKILNPPTKA